MKTKVFLHLFLAVMVLSLVGCETTRAKKGGYGKKANTWDRNSGFSNSDSGPATPGWWYARRDYNSDFAHWGKMRPLDGKSKDEQFVLLNENHCKAPHRGKGSASSDNNREYRFFGYFMAERAYEPASDKLCPVFVLQSWESLGAPMREVEEVAANEPPPVPEVDEPIAPAQATQANPTPSTNTVVKAKAKPAAKPVAKPVVQPVVKKKVPAPVTQ